MSRCTRVRLDEPQCACLGIKATGAFDSPFHDTPISMIDAGDVSKCAAAILQCAESDRQVVIEGREGVLELPFTTARSRVW